MDKRNTLPRICNTSADERMGGCACTECVYNLNHYDPQPSDWLITQKLFLDKQGKCLQSKGVSSDG